MMYAAFAGLPRFKSTKKALTLAIDHAALLMPGRCDVEYAPDPRRYTARNIPTVARFQDGSPASKDSLCSVALFFNPVSIASVNSIVLDPAALPADPAGFTLEPWIWSFAGAGASARSAFTFSD